MKRWLWMVVAIVPWVSVPAEEALSAGRVAMEPSALDRRLQAEQQAVGLGRILTTHRPTYILPFTYSVDPNDKPAEAIGVDDYRFDNVEIKFQFSVKALLAENTIDDNGDLYAAYTQQSLWQAYDADNSAPFRDTNYEPELFLAFETDYEVIGLHNRMIAFGAAHQSNGRGSETLSRSWNRIYAAFLLARGDFALQLKPWYRIPEDDEDDNNPRIENYVGYGDVKLAYRRRDLECAAIVRNNLKTDENRGSIQLDVTYPLIREVRAYIQYFNGYAETLLDYDHHDQRLGIGFMLGNWL